jgi:hypothetical protein
MINPSGQRSDPDCRDLIEAARAAQRGGDVLIIQPTKTMEEVIRTILPVWRPTLDNRVRPQHR